MHIPMGVPLASGLGRRFPSKLLATLYRYSYSYGARPMGIPIGIPLPRGLWR